MSRQRTLLILDPTDCGVESLISQALRDTTVSLDIISTHEFVHLNDLQAFLCKTYEILRYQAELLGKSKVFTRVLYNESYKEKQDYWDAIYINNKQMENKLALQIIDHLNYIEKPIIYLFSTSKSKFQVPVDSQDITQVANYKTSAVGGTFDHLHDGHKILLTIASFLTSTRLIIGITGPELLRNKKYKEFLETYDTRAQSALAFAQFVTPQLQYDLYEINDICGPTASVEDIDALVVSDESERGAKYINEVRQQKGFHLLQVHRITVVGGGSEQDNWADKLSSTKLRELEYNESLVQ